MNDFELTVPDLYGVIIKVALDLYINAIVFTPIKKCDLNSKCCNNYFPSNDSKNCFGENMRRTPP